MSHTAWAIAASPFILGLLLLAILKAIVMYSGWRYRRAQAKRNAKLVRFGLKPFPGTKEYYDDQH